MNRWIMRETDADLTLMSKVLGISQITANVMANRGLRSKKTAQAFLAPSIERMYSALQMADADKALGRIMSAIDSREKICIYGDYDADGIMCTTILHKTLCRLGAEVSYYIPHRIEEGYGLNTSAVEKLADAGIKLIITVDNGISAHAEVEAAAALGVSVVIIDHHEPAFTEEPDGSRKDILPAADAVVDPKRNDCPYPFKEMCAAGLTYKMSAALCEYAGKPLREEERDELLALAAVATLCDIVDLHDENRIIVNCGLVILNANKLINPGLGSLITQRGYLDKPINTHTVGFVIGPCLNAAGRLDSASLAVELLLAVEPQERIELAHRLVELNDERKDLTAECVKRAMADLGEGPKDKVLVLTDEDAHESVAGIVAGRIREAAGRPTILITQGGGDMKGSGRSIPAYNMFEALYANKELFLRFGGHAMAAGLSITAENIPALRDALNRQCILTDEDFQPIINIDRELAITDITLELSDELTRLAPFGRGNDEPLFISRRLWAENVRIIDDKNTLIFTFSAAGRRIKGLAFGMNEYYAEAIAEASASSASKLSAAGGIFMDVVYCIETNVYNGAVSVQVRVRDFRVVLEGKV